MRSRRGSLLATAVTACVASGCVAMCTIAHGIPGNGIEARETRTAGSFERVEVSGALDVRVTVGAGPEIRVWGDENLVPYVVSEIHGDTLQLYTSESVRPTVGLRVEVDAPSLGGLEASGATDVSVEGAVGDELFVACSGASEVRLSGTTGRLTLDVSGASDVDAWELVARDARVECSGASDVSVHALEELHVVASGASDVRYRGTPGSVQSEVSGAASVHGP